MACRTPCTFGVCLEFPRIFWNILLAHPDKSSDHRVSLPGCGQNQCPHPERHEAWPQHALSFPYPAKARTSFRYPAVARTSYPAVARLAYRQWPEQVTRQWPDSLTGSGQNQFPHQVLQHIASVDHCVCERVGVYSETFMLVNPTEKDR